VAVAVAVADSKAQRSRLVANVDLPYATLARELEKKISPRLADVHNRGIGMAGHLNYTVDRGPFAVMVSGDDLLVATDVHAHAEACSGNNCYASCAPEGRATVSVSLRLTPDYRFAPSRVAFAFSRGCEVRALGGVVRIDVTPTIAQEIDPQLRRVEHEIDADMPPLRPQAERIWAELGKTRPLPLGACLVTHPTGIVEGPLSGTANAVHLRFGLVAMPEVYQRCGDVSSAATVPSPLPPLAQDPSLAPEEELLLGLVTPVATTLAALGGAAPFDAGGPRAAIGRATATADGALVRADLTLHGDVCGDLAINTALAWTDDASALELATPSILPGDRERAVSAALDPNAVERGLATETFAPPLRPDALKELVPAVAAGLGDPTTSVTARVTDVKPGPVALRGNDVVASVRLRGSVDIVPK
jgi:hypothetical protein